MKSPLKFALSFLSLGLAAAAPAVLGQDTPPPPPPAAPADVTPPPAPPADQPSDQTPPPAKRGGGRRDPLKMLTEKLSLTPDQQQKVDDILKSQREQGKTIHEDTTLSDDDKKSKGRELMKATHEQIRALLTADQQKIFDAMPPMRGGGGGKKSDNN